MGLTIFSPEASRSALRAGCAAVASSVGIALVSVVITLPIPLAQADESGTVTEQSRSFDPTLYSGGDGSSRENAVVLMSRNEWRGVGSEYEWLNHNFPGCKPERQALTPWDGQGKRYDIIDVRKANGELIRVYFDISNL
jgi:hypothetical protein